MTNEELASRIKAGEQELMAELWEQVRKLMLFMLRRLLEGNPENQARAIRAGVTLEDLEQESYFALCDAIKAYDPATGLKLSSYLNFHVMNHFFTAIGMRTKRRRAEPLSKSASVDEDLTGDGFSLLDHLHDPEAERQLDDVLESMYQSDLREALEECLKGLPERAESVIRCRYYKNMTLDETGADLALSKVRIRQIEEQALDELAEMERLRECRDDVIATRAYKGGFRRFKDTRTSSVELAVEKLDRLEKRESAMAALRNRSIDWVAIRAK